jgi:hypothetical protein
MGGSFYEFTKFFPDESFPDIMEQLRTERSGNAQQANLVA